MVGNFLDEEQCGFRGRRGTDDCLQVSRRIVEEVCGAETSDRVLLVSYDLGKAYPRVGRDALWKLFRRIGADERFIKICIALHESTS